MKIQDYIDDQEEKIFNILEKIEKDEDYRKTVNEKLGNIFALVDLKRKVIVKKSNNCMMIYSKALLYDKKYNGDWYPYILPIYNWVNFYKIEEFFEIEDFNIMLDLCYKYVFKGRYFGTVTRFPLTCIAKNGEKYRTFYGQKLDSKMEYNDFIDNYDFDNVDDGYDKFIKSIENSEIAELYSNDIDLNFEKYLGEFIEVKIMNKYIKIPLNWKTFNAIYKTLKKLYVEIDIKNDIGIHITDIMIEAFKNNDGDI